MSRQPRIDQAVLAATLHYGAPISAPLYRLTLPFDIEVLEAARRRREATPQSSEARLAEGAQLWQSVCRRTADRAAHPLLVPLSAGLDSRAVLAGLRACDVPVHTVTYGMPGAFDYELAPRVAHRAGATHERIDLQTTEITRERLLEVARKAERPSLLIDMFFNNMIAARYQSQRTYVSGFAGDALAGNNLSVAGRLNWEDARRACSDWLRASRTARLTNDDMNPLGALPEKCVVDPALLSPMQQLDYAIRQQRLIRPIVCPSGVEVMTPFLDPEWCIFMLGLPEALRRDRRFFIELFQRSFPGLFSVPTSASGGLPLGASPEAIQRHRRRLRRRRRLRLRLSRIAPAVTVPPADRGWQYLDFRTLLRGNGALAALFADSMARLDDRGITPWINARTLFQAHCRKEADHFKALNVLLNLELLLEARPALFDSNV